MKKTMAEEIADIKRKLDEVENLVSDEALDRLKDQMSLHEWGGNYCHATNDDISTECVGFSNKPAAYAWIAARKVLGENWSFGMGGCSA